MINFPKLLPIISLNVFIHLTTNHSVYQIFFLYFYFRIFSLILKKGQLIKSKFYDQCKTINKQRKEKKIYLNCDSLLKKKMYCRYIKFIDAHDRKRSGLVILKNLWILNMFIRAFEACNCTFKNALWTHFSAVCEVCTQAHTNFLSLRLSIIDSSIYIPTHLTSLKVTSHMELEPFFIIT